MTSSMLPIYAYPSKLNWVVDGRMQRAGEFVEGMRHFKEWATMVAMSKHDSELVTPVRYRNQSRLAFSIDGYNYFVSHSTGLLPKVRDAKDLISRISRYRRYLYRGETAFRWRKSGLFLVPNRI